MATDPKDPTKKRPAPPPAAPRDATDVVPGGQPQSLYSDVVATSELTDPLRKGTPAEWDLSLGNPQNRPPSGAFRPHPVPVGDVSAAHGMLSPAGGMASMRAYHVTRHPDGTETSVEVDPSTGRPLATPSADDMDRLDAASEDESDKQAAAMHAETDKRNADIRSRRPRAPGERY